MNLYKNCLICNKQFAFLPYRTETAKYCSTLCQHKSLVGSTHKGKPVSEETKEKLRKANLGKKHTLQTRIKMRESHKKNRYSRMGENHWKWNGGRKKCGKRIYILCHDHPFANKTGYIKEHRLICEKYLERYLEPTEVVHHINGNSLDNRPKNLFVFENFTEHFRFHLLSKSYPFLKTWIKSNLLPSPL